MRVLILAALVAIPLFAAPATAAEGRMSTLEFGRANRCLAYANLAPLQGDGVDFSGLQQRFEGEFSARPKPTQHSAKEEARRIRISAQSASSEREIATLRARRDLECRAFTTGMTANGAAPQNGG